MVIVERLEVLLQLLASSRIILGEIRGVFGVVCNIASSASRYFDLREELGSLLVYGY